MKQTSIGCGLLVFIVGFVSLTGFQAYAAVFSYFYFFEGRNSPNEVAITNELWLQNMLNHPSAPPCYTLDATLCATAVQVQTSPGFAGYNFWTTVIAGVIPALICIVVMWRILRYRRQRKALRQQAATAA